MPAGNRLAVGLGLDDEAALGLFEHVLKGAGEGRPSSVNLPAIKVDGHHDMAQRRLIGRDP